MGREPASGKTKGNGASRLSSHPRLTPLLARGQPSSLRSSFLRLSPHYAPQAGAPKGRYTIRSTKGQGTVADRVAGSALPSATRVNKERVKVEKERRVNEPNQPRKRQGSGTKADHKPRNIRNKRFIKRISIVLYFYILQDLLWFFLGSQLSRLSSSLQLQQFPRLRNGHDEGAVKQKATEWPFLSSSLSSRRLSHSLPAGGAASRVGRSDETTIGDEE